MLDFVLKHFGNETVRLRVGGDNAVLVRVREVLAFRELVDKILVFDAARTRWGFNLYALGTGGGQHIFI